MNVDRMSMVISTTPVEPRISSRVDHVTFCISARTSERNFLILPSIPMPLISGAAGIEPAVPVLETGGLPLTDAPNAAIGLKNAFFNK